MADKPGQLVREGSLNIFRLFISGAFIAVMAGTAWAQSSQSKPLPLFDAFQNYCAIPDGSVEAIEAAVNRGTGSKVPMDAATAAKILSAKGITNQDVWMWDVSMPDHKMMLTVMAHKKDMPYGSNDYAFTCMIIS